MKNRERVGIISLYDDRRLDYSIKKEEQLKKYCKSKNYKVENIFRDMQNWNVRKNLFSIIGCLEEIKMMKQPYEKIIMYGIDEIGLDLDYMSIYSIFDIYEITLETISNGTLKKDLQCYSVVSENVEVKEKNKKFIVYDDSPY